MSKVFRDISSIDTMPSHVEAPSRLFGHTVGKSAFRPGLATQNRERLNLQFGGSNYMENLSDRRFRSSPIPPTVMPLQTRLNQDSRTGTFVQRSVATRTFGLQARNLQPSLAGGGMSLQDISDVHHKSGMSTVSRTFGLVPEDVNAVRNQRNENSHLDLRRIGEPRTFGLQTRNLTMNSGLFSENENPDLDLTNGRRNNVSAVSRTFDQSVEKVGGGLGARDNEGFIRGLRRNGSVSSSFVAKPFGHQSRSFTVHPSLHAEGNFRANGLSSAFDGLGPPIRSSTIIAESRVQDRGSCNDDLVDSGGFRRPTLSRVIRGRNSLLSSRVFHSRDLSNLNGFSVSHIGRRDAESLSDSRLGLNTRSKWMDNQSMAGSVCSTASMKGQFMNLLENLHHSILNIGPHVTAEAVRMEFDKAKQGLENLCEMSLAPSVKEADAGSVISYSSKNIYAPINEPGTNAVIDGGSLHLKSSKEILKSLMSGKDSHRRKLSTHTGEGVREKTALTTSLQDSDDEEVSGYLFKEPTQLFKDGKTSRKAKITASKAIKNSAAEAPSKVFSLKQWYPLALGSELALCGVDEQGVTVKTDPVKKRLNSRRVELVSGLICDLIGSPSPIVSALPKRVAGLLKNGLTERWRILREELVTCQAAEKEFTPRKSRSPKSAGSPRKKKKGASAAGGKTDSKKAKKAQRKSPKVVCEAKKMKTPRANKGKSKSRKISISVKRSGNEVLTRSGRAVKPPTMFWIVGGSIEVSSSHTSETPVTTSTGSSTRKQCRRSNEGTSAKTKKASSGTPKKQQRKNVEGLAASASPSKHSPQGKSKTSDETPSRGKAKGEASKVLSSEEIRKRKSEEEGRVLSSTEEVTKRNGRANKRKREVGGDTDVMEAKKSKLARVLEVESTVADSKAKTKAGKKKKAGLSSSPHLTKVKAKKSPAKKSNKNSKKKTSREAESEKEKKAPEEEKEFEDFELQLDDIEIPEIASMGGRPQLTRSQLRVVSMETPPLKYFNSNLRLLRSATPLPSPDWCISQRTESEVKRFQKRREVAFKKTRVDVKQTVVTEKATKTIQNKELKRVMEWITEKTVKSPVWNSKVVQYLIPSRKLLQQQDDNDEEEGGGESEFIKPSLG